MSKGDVIFRARMLTDKSAPCEPNHCYDTGKDGLYFSDFPLLAMSMALEYKCDMELYIYRIEDQITFDEGKYSFRNCNPERYFSYDVDDDCHHLIPNVEPLPEEMINHYDDQCLSICDAVSNCQIRMLERMRENQVLGELFIAEKDLHKINFIDSVKIDASALEDNFLEALESILMDTYGPVFNKSIIDSILSV